MTTEKSNKPNHIKEAALAYQVALPAAVPPTEHDLFNSDGRFVSEEDYFTYYYEFGDVSYEWNNGILEAKSMAEAIKTWMYAWFLQLLLQYLEEKPIAKYIMLEIGFIMEMDDPEVIGAIKRVVRKPDLGIILNDNPIVLGDHDRTYMGICDICIESISDSDREQIERDTVQKKREYSQAGVKEYFILDDENRHMHFYRLNDLGHYVEIEPDANGVIRSNVLQGFQFRKADLEAQPRLIKMAKDPIYQGFVLTEYQEAVQQAQEADEQTKKAVQQAQEAAQRIQEATQQAQEATQQAQEATQQAQEAAQEAQEATQQAQEATQQAQEATQRAQEAEERELTANQRIAQLEAKLREALKSQ